MVIDFKSWRDRRWTIQQASGVNKLTAAQIKSALGKISGWKKSSETITRTFIFKDFPASIRFVDAIAKLVEQAWHHPDIDIRWNKVTLTLTLTTHDSGGLTRKDFQLAAKFDQVG